MFPNVIANKGVEIYYTVSVTEKYSIFNGLLKVYLESRADVRTRNTEGHSVNSGELSL